LKPEEVNEINLQNEEVCEYVCASHNFCDSNMAMAEAFKNVFKQEHNIHSDEENKLWCNAWDEAKSNRFYIN
jgi:hypothetical protein